MGWLKATERREFNFLYVYLKLILPTGPAEVVEGGSGGKHKATPKSRWR